MRIIYVSTEIANLIKVGGLGDVVYSLSKELAQKNLQISVITPKYKSITPCKLKGFSFLKNVTLYEKKKKLENLIWHKKIDKVDFFLVDSFPDKNYFHRKNVYGYKDDDKRFLYFSKVAAFFINTHFKKIDAIHLHDWHTSAVTFFVKKNIKTILTIHSAKYQGITKKSNLIKIGVEQKDIEKTKQIIANKTKYNLLKAGISICNHITVVSPTYAKEILKDAYGLEKDFKKNQKKISGILNGIDQNTWDPEKDKTLYANYSSKNTLDDIINIKEKNKKYLRKILKLKQNNKPLIINIGRLVYQKGPKLIKKAIINSINHKKFQFISLNSVHINEITKDFLKLKKQCKDNKDIKIILHYDDELSHLLFASADFIFIPSVFEPCGLTQLIAMRYGTIPIVRETGGLKDTIFDVNNKKQNGYCFKKYLIKSMEKTFNIALTDWYENDLKLKKMKKYVMQIDHSWKNSIQKYIKIYES